MTFSDPTVIEDEYNFTNLPDDAIPEISSAYSISFAFLTSSTVDTVTYGDNGTYYNSYLTYDSSSEFLQVTSEAQDAFRTIMKVAAPGTTYTADPWSDYYGDVAKISFAEQTGTSPNAAIAIGSLNDDPNSPLFSNLATANTSVMPTSGTFSGTSEFTVQVTGGTATTIVVGGDTTEQIKDQLLAAGLVAAVEDDNHIFIATTTNVALTLADGSTGHTGGLAALGLVSGTIAPSANYYAFTNSYYSTISTGSALYGDIWLNYGNSGAGTTPAIDWSTTISPGSKQFLTLLHELGHSLGLDHPPSSDPTEEWYTIMFNNSANDPFPGMSSSGPGGLPVFLSGLQMDDIYAVQDIYGANYTTRSGNDAYGLGHGFGSSSATSSSAFVYTIWDGGGTNVIDASSYSGPSIINLNQAQLSSIGPADGGAGTALDNVGIAYGTVIQNAIGTQGSTIFIGNLWNDVLAGAAGSSGNVFYTDQTISPIAEAGINWSHNANPSTVGSHWTIPMGYVAAPDPSVKANVLIGDGTGNIFVSGLGYDVIDGGYNKSDITNATQSVLGGTIWGASGTSNYWDSAYQFTGDPSTITTGNPSGTAHNISGTPLADIADSASTGNEVDYSKLSTEDTSITPGSGLGIRLIASSLSDAAGHPVYTVYKNDANDGEDRLVNIQYLIGSGGDDRFVLPNGTGNVPLSIIESGSGHSLYLLPMTTAPSYSGGAYVNGDIFINDTTGHGDVVLQALPGVQMPTIQFGYYASEPSWMPAGEFTSGDKIMEIQVGDGTNGTAFAYLDMTTAAAGTGVGNIEIGGINFSAQALATYELGLGTGFDPSGGPAGLYTDIYGTGPSDLLPGPIYDTTSGQIIGMAAPSYASSGAGNFVGGSFATEIDHPWVITGYAGALGGPGDVTINIQTYIDAAILNVAASDVRIVWGGPSSDTLTVYAVSEAQSFTIQDFTQGMTIHGIGFLGNEEYNALASHLTGLTASSPGNYTGGFSDSTGVAVGTGFDVTYWLENMFFSDGTGWNMQSGPLTFTSATDGQNLYSRDGYNDTLVALNNYDVLTGSTGNTTMVAGPDSALYQGTGTDTDVFSTGASPISGGGDAVELNTSGGTASIVLHGITPSAVTMWDTGAGEFLIQYSSTDVIRVYGGTDGSSGFTMGSLTGITFDDTTHWNLTAGLTLTATSDYQYIDGTTGGGDTLIALGAGDSLTAYAGTETLVAGHGAYLYNGTGNDTDVFSAGTAPVSGGGDHVYEGTGSGTTTVAFHGIDPSAVTMWDDNYGHLTIQFSSTDQITVLGGSLDYTNGFTLGSLTQITFDDTGHTTWDLTGGLNLVATSDYQYLYGTTGGGDTLTATGTGNTLYAYAGAETLVAGPGANLYNGTGNDIDVINSGSSPSTSSATIHANASGGTDNVIQVHDVVSADITMWDDTYGNLTVATPSDQFTIAGGSYSGTTGFAVGNIDHITLDDSSTIGLQGSLNLTAVNDSQTIYGTGHGDNMTAAGNYDFLYGIAGNNTMTGDSGTTYFYGGSGNDTMVAGSGTNYMTMGTGSDEIKVEGSSSTTYVNGFNASNDTIHLEDVMTGYDSLTDALSNWAQKTEVGGSTVIAVDPTGAGSFTAGPQVTLNSVTGLDDLATLVAHGVVHV